MKRVVIVDDQPQILEVLQRFYNLKSNVTTMTYSNPHSALEYIRINPIDLVVSDITMPELDGISFLQEIKKIKPKLQVIMITAEPTLERVIKSHKFDALDFMIKPIDIKELDKISDTLLQ